MPKKLQKQSYDVVISTYAMHHLADEEKVDFIKQLFSVLNVNGRILIGDIAFPSRQELLFCREQAGDDWDEEEYYFVFEELKSDLKAICYCAFHPYSFCGGVIVLRPIQKEA
ncbi:class I SAM-dependent methyltransferase [Aureibacillus halotolerans]|uniref:Methyltransferase family protein n=1 Tax=Aureibacillus halotolerans TaxID=1508390 RepID=A0A4R6U2D1_9BACI|nr:hypothetical protein [Aureibacillus halotolerans]TDQ40500.1 hypothetical protein EV213_106220 [Aureibacillus halotolerans]